MSTLAEMLRDTTTLEPSESEWLHLLVGDWQLIADLSFADLVLWVRGGLDGWRAVAHVRPNTGPMVFYDDIVGRSSTPRPRLDARPGGPRPADRQQAASPRCARTSRSARMPCPSCRDGRVIAVVTRHQNLTGARTPSRLELTYRELADSLMRMVAAGDFPSVVGADRHAARRPAGRGRRHPPRRRRAWCGTPARTPSRPCTGWVTSATWSGRCWRRSSPTSRRAAAGRSTSRCAVVVTGRAAWRSEVETPSATVTLRAIPLTVDGRAHRGDGAAA